jgi:hypothetical protein
MALLNKLLRTPDASLRSNIIGHYLTPAPNTITSPDGKTIQLAPTSGSSSGSAPPSLVSIQDFIAAVDTFVSQVRTIEEQQHQPSRQEQGGVTETAALVESARLLCKQVLGTLAGAHGAESGQVRLLKDGLQPVFRPGETAPSAPAGRQDP